MDGINKIFVVLVTVQNLVPSGWLSKRLKITVYRSIVLSFVLYCCEIWSFTLREERRLRVSENRMLRRMFGPKRDWVDRGVEKTT